MPTSDVVLARVRKLLAVAEHPATPPAEAENAAEAAERLILKHAIDEALLDAKADHRSKPELRTIEIDAPYVSAKLVLLANVAGPHNVEVVTRTGSAQAFMVGFRSDLQLVDLLFTSLLLQAAGAMLRQPNSSRAFRRAFLIGFAGEVGRRLAELRVEAVAESGGASTEIALRGRHDEVQEAMHEHFPRLGTRRTSISDGGGLLAGQQSGAAANLSTGNNELSGRRTALGG
jgi:hypothetical protein